MVKHIENGLALIEKWLRNKNTIEFLGIWEDYRIHTDAIKRNIIPEKVTPQQASVIYANEADVLNVAMFGMTAKQWREANANKKGNIRDYATINELICLSNMENLNAVFIDQGLPQGERLVKLNQIAIQQMKVLDGDNNRELIK